MPRLLVVPNPAPESSAQSSAWVDTAPPGVASSRHGELQDPGRVGRRHDRPHQLNRPAQLNPLSTICLRELVAAADWFDARDEVRVVIVHGAGRAFSAGADLASFGDPAGTLPRDAADAGRDGRGDRGDAGGHDRSRPRALCRRRCGVGGRMRSADRRRVRVFRSRRSTSASRSPGAGSSDWCERSVQLQPANWSSPADRSAPPRRSARDAEHGRRRRRAPRRGAGPRREPGCKSRLTLRATLKAVDAAAKHSCRPAPPGATPTPSSTPCTTRNHERSVRSISARGRT